MKNNCMPAVRFEHLRLTGQLVERQVRTIGDLGGIFYNKDSLNSLPQDTVVYEVESYLPVQAGLEGGLFLGITYIYPGKVGDEYFMTKGHFHRIRNRGEFYIGMEGEGMLILMDEKGKTWVEEMAPGTVHYIPGNTAHRTANTGSQTLSFGACWPADAGHDYDIIALNGFSKILVDRQGTPTLITKN